MMINGVTLFWLFTLELLTNEARWVFPWRMRCWILVFMVSWYSSMIEYVMLSPILTIRELRLMYSYLSIARGRTLRGHRVASILR